MLSFGVRVVESRLESLDVDPQTEVVRMPDNRCISPRIHVTYDSTTNDNTTGDGHTYVILFLYYVRGEGVDFATLDLGARVTWTTVNIKEYLFLSLYHIIQRVS